MKSSYPPLYAVVGANDGQEYDRVLFVEEDELRDLSDRITIFRFDNGLLTFVGDDCCIRYSMEDELLLLEQLLTVLTKPGVFCVDYADIVKTAKPVCEFKSATFDKKTFYNDILNWEIDDKEIKSIFYLLNGDLDGIPQNDLTCVIEELQEKHRDPWPSFNIIHNPESAEGKVRLSVLIGQQPFD